MSRKPKRNATRAPEAPTAPSAPDARSAAAVAAPGARPPAAWFAGVAILGVAFLAHAWIYRFLTDDAFISFRYARNFAHGAGLVFNPGFERVEGYSNFLWVIVLAALDRIGLAPERAAIPLSLLLSAGLFAVVAVHAWRTRIDDAPWWTSLVAPALLAATRSVAVWSTSGLETRLFELLVVAGALRLQLELAAARKGATVRWLSPWGFALASLTRPDGPLLAAAAVAVAVVVLGARDRRLAGRYLLAQWPVALLVGGHLAFRLAYYGDWLPNTYYAKVGGRTWWSAGGTYLFTFAIEYAAWLWLPVAAFGAWRRSRAGDGAGAALLVAMIVPHAIYVASIGGDHFEYRPLDLAFPFLFLLAGDGIGALARGRAGFPAAVAVTLLTLFGLVHLPWRSHVEFPPGYIAGFPGLGTQPDARGHYLDPDRDPIDRLPGLRALAEAHRNGLRTLTHRFIGVRQEEHARFDAKVVPIGLRLRRMVDEGQLPRDVHFVTPSVGVVPYLADVRTLDELGLTDRQVAHSAPQGERIMAHDRHATDAYLRERGADLRGLDLFLGTDSPAMVSRIRDALVGRDSSWVAAISDSEMIVCGLPSGIESARRRMPKLEFHRLDDPAIVERVAERVLPRRRREFAEQPGDGTALELATALLVCGRYDEGARLYDALTRRLPERPILWENLAMCRLGLGDLEGGLVAMDRAAALANAAGDTEDAERLATRRARIAAAMGSAASPR